MRKSLFFSVLLCVLFLFQESTVGQTNLALNKSATASSTSSSTYSAAKAVDGNASTMWCSNSETNPWIYVDLGSTQSFNKVLLNWSTYYGTAYKLQTSSNASTWTDLTTLLGQNGGLDSVTGLNGNARYIRLYVTTRSNTAKGVYLNEFAIYNIDTQSPTAPTNLVSTSITSSTFTLSWTASTDNVGVTSYEVFKNGTSIGSTASTSINATGFSCNTSYTMTVKAKDAAGNVSASSSPLNVTTSSCQDTIYNSSFESPVISVNSYLSSPTDSYWTFTGSGIVSNGSAFGNPNAPTGTQAAFIQEQNSLSQTVNFSAGTHAIKFKAANRNGFGNQTFSISVGSNIIASYTVSNSDYTTFITPAFTVTAGNQIVKFTGLNSTDNTVFIDDVNITSPDVQLPTAPTALMTYAVSQTGLTLMWTASTDNASVYSYEVFDGINSLGTTSTTNMNIAGLSCNTTHTLTIKAKDTAGNISAASTVLNVTTNPCSTGNLVQNSSFEYPVLSLQTYSYNSTDSNWTFSGNSGIVTNGCAFGNVNAPTGNQAAFIQQTGFISQKIPIVSSGTYIMSFQAAARSGFGTQTIQISVGSTVIGTFTISNTNYQYFTTSTFTASTGNVTLTIAGQTSADVTAFVDDINIDVPDTQTPTAPSNLVASSVQQTTLTLSWTASTDNIGVVAYDVYCNGTLNTTVTGITANILNLSDTTAYVFSVKARDLAGNVSPSSNTLNVTTLAWPAYKIGTNFWNLGWGIWSDCFQSNINWATTTNPWLSTFLTDIAVYNGPIRFMDWCGANNTNDSIWSSRTQKTDDQYNSIVNNKSLAWEWMIDLCNRTNHDMWINVPYKSDSNYWTQLATLIKNNLNSNLKVYIEYANETWNGGMASFGYVIGKGNALGLPPTDNIYYQGGAFTLFQAINIWQIFQNVFGASAMGNRIMRTYAFSGNFDIAEQAYVNILLNGGNTWNSSGQTADIFAIAPYIGPYDDAAGDGSSLDGAATNIATRFRTNVDWNFTNYITPAVTMAAKYGKPICTYEAGQQLNTNADAWSANPAIYTEYTYMFNKWKQAKFQFVNHYTHTGAYYPGGAWGAKPSTSATLSQSPKYEAIVDWLNINKKQNVNEVVSVLQNENDSKFSIFPNPTNDYVNIDLKSMNESAMVTVSDLSGNVIYKKNYYKVSKIVLNTKSLIKGMCFVNIVSGNDNITSKLIVK